MSESQRPYEIRGWDAGDNNFDMSIRVNGFRFTIAVSPDCFVNSPCALKLFGEIFDKIASGEDEDPEVWTYSEHVADTFVPEFERLAPPVLHAGKLTLADLAVRGSFECEYRVVDEKAIAGPVLERVLEDIPPPEEWDMRFLQSSFPIVDPAEVEPYDAIDEVEKYSRIYASGLSTQQLSTSRLFDVVAGRDGQAKGLLYDWIETTGTGTLTSAMSLDTPVSLREKWASQIRSTAGLHSLGIVWGDVKPDNVLIDTDDNAVVIDLEGGTTRGWVDRDVGGSVEGDLQGLERVVDFILNESPRLVADSDGSQDDS